MCGVCVSPPVSIFLYICRWCDPCYCFPQVGVALVYPKCARAGREGNQLTNVRLTRECSCAHIFVRARCGIPSCVDDCFLKQARPSRVGVPLRTFGFLFVRVACRFPCRPPPAHAQLPSLVRTAGLLFGVWCAVCQVRCGARSVWCARCGARCVWWGVGCGVRGVVCVVWCVVCVVWCGVCGVRCQALLRQR